MSRHNAEHACYVCKREFQYNYETCERGLQTLVKKGVEAESVIATGNAFGGINQYEIIAKCPNCGTLNKINI